MEAGEAIVLGLGIPLVIIGISVIVCIATEVEAWLNLHKRERLD